MINKEDYLTESEMAAFLGCTVGTLRKNRSLGKNHPPFIRMGNHVLFPKKLFQEWLNKKKIHREAKSA